MRRPLALAAALVAVLTLVGCAGDDTGGAIDSGGTAPLRQGVTTTVSLAAAGATLVAAMTGPAESPGPGDADGTGTATLTITPDGKVCARISVNGLDEATAAHIHTGVAGLAGPVLVTLPTPKAGAADACVTATPAQVSAILASPTGYYVNVHTAAFPNGAVRGQLAKS
jgi:hypothetical protein